MGYSTRFTVSYICERGNVNAWSALMGDVICMQKDLAMLQGLMVHMSIVSYEANEDIDTLWGTVC